MSTDTNLVCSECGKEIESGASAIDSKGNRYCYQCCAKRDVLQMRADGRITLYLTGMRHGDSFRQGMINAPEAKIINWPGSLEIMPLGNNVKVGRHNLGGKRFDVWFAFDGYIWHGVNIGDNDLLRCRKTAQRSKSNPAPRVHYIGMAGLCCYMPNYTTVGDTRGAVADDLGRLHDLSQRRVNLLRRDMYCDLDLRKEGNEYCEIVRCECETPGDHTEEGEYGEYGNSTDPRAPMGVKFDKDRGIYRIVG